MIPHELKESWQEIQQPAVIHAKDRLIHANEPFLHLFGYGRLEQVAGRQMGEFISPWSPFHLRMGIREATGRRLGGDTFDIEVICTPLYSEEEPIFSSIIRDLSQRKSWEGKLLQSERLTAMGKLAGEIAHEINNPLGGILLYANLLKEDLVPDHASLTNLNKIIKLATKCRIIAKGLLNFGRSSSRSYMTVDLNQVVREMFGLVEDHKLFKQIDTEFLLSDDLPHLMGDRGQIEQVVLNLVINAGEAMQGKGRLTIETGLLEGQGKVVLRVSDTGPGVPEQIMPRIFEPFFTTKPQGKGTGLGLSITHGIVQRHGGRIEVSNRPEGGAQFEVLLPVSGG
jgi:PAS domain S-box-containing protein